MPQDKQENSKRAMPYRHLGRTGLKVSALSLGSWVTFKNQLDVKPAYALMKQAYENGINFFDNAEGYANGDSERVMGEAIKLGIKEKTWTREELVVTTKLYIGILPEGKKEKDVNATGCSRKHLYEGLVGSLKRMQLDYVDVVFCHRQDLETPIEETVRAMNNLIARGLAFYWGTSEWTAQAITEAHEIARRLNLEGPCCDQTQYNVLWRDRIEVEYERAYKKYGIGLTTWSPLMSGILTGKYSKGIPEGSRLSLPDMGWLKDRLLDPSKGWVEKADKFVAFAEELGLSPAQLAIAWCLKNSHVSTVILGATSAEQLDENLSALDALPKVTEVVLGKINDIFGAPEWDATSAQALAFRGKTSKHPSTVLGVKRD